MEECARLCRDVADLTSLHALFMARGSEPEQDRVSAAIEETITTGEAVVEAEVLTKSGDQIPHEFTGDRVTDELGNLIGFVGSGRDITNREERERRLKELNQMGHKLMAAGNREEVATIAVESAAAILGLDATGIHLFEADQSGLVPVAQTPASKKLVSDPPTFTGGDSIAWQVYEDGESVTFDNVRNDPNVYNPETSIRSELFLPIEEHGVLIASATDPQAFDEEDILLGKILVGTIAASLDQVERTDQLRTRERELREQNERLEEFTSVVSHDLQNPLQVAIGRVELMLDESHNEHLDTIAASLDRMDMLITDLLTLARDGDRANELETISLEPLAKNTWQHVGTGEATLVVTDDMTIRADENRFRQLLENLMGNAVEHGGTDVTVTVGTHDAGFFVEDDGPGIPEDEREHVFMTGYSTTEQGTGFGLRIIQQVVDAHDWTIHVSEVTTGGARFEINTTKNRT